MTTKNAFIKTGFFTIILMAIAIFLTNCAKDETVGKMAKDNLTAQSVQIPSEIEMYLTEAEQADFYASKPDYTPVSSGLEMRSGDWHPFFASGDVEGARLPLLGGCDKPALANICPGVDIPGLDVCNDPANYVGYATLYAGNTTLAGFGPVKQFLSNYVCGFDTGANVGMHNGSFKKGNGSLYFRSNGTPAETKTNDDGSVSVERKITICNAARKSVECVAYSTGDFKDADGDGTITTRLTSSPDNLDMAYFEPFKKSQLIAWGWLYY